VIVNKPCDKNSACPEHCTTYRTRAQFAVVVQVSCNRNWVPILCAGKGKGVRWRLLGYTCWGEGTWPNNCVAYFLSFSGV